MVYPLRVPVEIQLASWLKLTESRSGWLVIPPRAADLAAISCGVSWVSRCEEVRGGGREEGGSGALNSIHSLWLTFEFWTTKVP